MQPGQGGRLGWAGLGLAWVGLGDCVQCVEGTFGAGPQLGQVGSPKLLPASQVLCGLQDIPLASALWTPPALACCLSFFQPSPTPLLHNPALQDVKLPEDDTKDLSIDDRDLIVGNVYRKLMEIESRLLPCGLHVVGCPPTAEEAVATLVGIAELERPDNTPPLAGLPGILARAVGRDIEEVYAGNNKGVLADVEMLQQITEASRACVGMFVRDRTGLDGRIGTNWLASLSKNLGLSVDPWVRALQGTRFAAADRLQLVELFRFLEFCLNQVVQDNELGALREASGGGRPGLNCPALPCCIGLHTLVVPAAGRGCCQRQKAPHVRAAPPRSCAMPPAAMFAWACLTDCPSPDAHCCRPWMASIRCPAQGVTPSATRACCPLARTSTPLTRRWAGAPATGCGGAGGGGVLPPPTCQCWLASKPRSGCCWLAPAPSHLPLLLPFPPLPRSPSPPPLPSRTPPLWWSACWSGRRRRRGASTPSPSPWCSGAPTTSRPMASRSRR